MEDRTRIGEFTEAVMSKLVYVYDLKPLDESYDYNPVWEMVNNAFTKFENGEDADDIEYRRRPNRAERRSSKT